MAVPTKLLELNNILCKTSNFNQKVINTKLDKLNNQLKKDDKRSISEKTINLIKPRNNKPIDLSVIKTITFNGIFSDMF